MYIKEDVDRWFDYSYLPSQRLIYIGSHENSLEEGESGTDCFMAEFFTKAIVHLNTISKKPIIVHMNNLGGDEFHGFAIYDAIRMSKAHVYGIAWGYAMSMGSIILQAFDTRIMAPNAVLMIHDGSESINAPCKTYEAWAKYSSKSRKRMYEIYLSRMKATKTRMTLKKIEELCVHDSIFNAQETVNYGLADWVMETIDDPYEYYATEKENAKWQPGMTLGKHIIEEEEE